MKSPDRDLGSVGTIQKAVCKGIGLTCLVVNDNHLVGTCWASIRKKPAARLLLWTESQCLEKPMVIFHRLLTGSKLTSSRPTSRMFSSAKSSVTWAFAVRTASLTFHRAPRYFALTIVSMPARLGRLGVRAPFGVQDYGRRAACAIEDAAVKTKPPVSVYLFDPTPVATVVQTGPALKVSRGGLVSAAGSL